VTTVEARTSELALKNGVERIDLILRDADGTLVDATELSLRICDLSDATVYEDDFFSPPSPPGVTRIVHPSTGKYYFPLGDQALFPLTVGGDDNLETASARRLLAVWSVTGPAGSEQANIVQNIRVISARTMALVGDLRLLIDKALKSVNEDPESPCFLGYTDAQLVQYLEGGLSTWNMYEPYPTFSNLDNFPMLYSQGLIESALLVGTMSQELFAIDTDVPNYSAQGSAFVIQHQPQLAAFLTMMAQRLDKLIPIAKLKLVNSGSLHVQATPNYRLSSLVQMAPGGALFRNFLVRS